MLGTISMGIGPTLSERRGFEKKPLPARLGAAGLRKAPLADALGRRRRSDAEHLSDDFEDALHGTGPVRLAIGVSLTSPAVSHPAKSDRQLSLVNSGYQSNNWGTSAVNSVL